MEVVIIVAGGSGSRMKSDLPKQFLNLAGKPILMRTIEAFHTYSTDIRIILVLPERHFQFWGELKAEYDFTIPHEIVAGGQTRTESVRNGLSVISDEDIVAIHDGVRPLISPEVIGKAFNVAMKESNAIVCVSLKDSIRKINKEGRSESVDRKYFRQVQTPQVFRGQLIKEAYQTTGSADQEFTDDASVFEYYGRDIHLIEGDFSNIKITTPEDIIIAESIWKNRI